MQVFSWEICFGLEECLPLDVSSVFSSYTALLDVSSLDLGDLAGYSVGVPCRRMMDIVTVKCGHCNHLSFLSPRPMVQTVNPNDHPISLLQSPRTDFLRAQPSASSPSSSNEQTAQNPPVFVVKPPEKKHRTPSAYNRFMKEEIKRIKAAQPAIPHREAFSMAAKNWAKCDSRCSSIVSTSDTNKMPPIKGINSCLRVESSNVYKGMEQKS